MTNAKSGCTAALALALAGGCAMPGYEPDEPDANLEQGDIFASGELLTAEDGLGAELLDDGWSAAQMIGTRAVSPRGRMLGWVDDIIVSRDGQVTHLVVSPAPPSEEGWDRALLVPWPHASIAPRMAAVTVRPEGARAVKGLDLEPLGPWTVDELLGDPADLRDFVGFGRVRDVIFSPEGRAKAVVVASTVEPWAPGMYVYPFKGYGPYWAVYPIEYSMREVRLLQPFDYRSFARESVYAAAPARWR